MAEKTYIVNPNTDQWIEVTPDCYTVEIDPRHFPRGTIMSYGLLHAADNVHAQVSDFSFVDVNTPSVKSLGEFHGVDVDDLVAKYSEKLQDIYDCQTAGDYTFTGVLAVFLMELDGRW